MVYRACVPPGTSLGGGCQYTHTHLWSVRYFLLLGPARQLSFPVRPGLQPSLYLLVPPRIQRDPWLYITSHSLGVLPLTRPQVGVSQRPREGVAPAVED